MAILTADMHGHCMPSFTGTPYVSGDMWERDPVDLLGTTYGWPKLTEAGIAERNRLWFAMSDEVAGEMRSMSWSRPAWIPVPEVLNG